MSVVASTGTGIAEEAVLVVLSSVLSWERMQMADGGIGNVTIMALRLDDSKRNIWETYDTKYGNVVCGGSKYEFTRCIVVIIIVEDDYEISEAHCVKSIHLFCTLFRLVV